MELKIGPPKKYLVFACRAICILCLLAFTGCAWLTKPPVVDPLAGQLVEGLTRANGDLKQYKALSRVRLELAEEVQSVSSMALAAVYPNMMRVELLSSVGQPMTSMVADGKTIRIRAYGKKRIYRFRQSTTALEHLINIPIGVEQLQGALIGRPVLPEYVGAQLMEQSPTTVKVALKDRWRQSLALLEFEAGDASIRGLEVFGEEGRSLYRVKWLRWRQIGAYRVPSKLMVENDSGYRVTVSVRRFWPDVALAPATFELDGPDQVQ